MYRAEWTFTFDRKNRLKSFTNEGASNVRTNLWYDGMGRVWQRWNDNTSSGDWDETLMRYVYDGNSLAQEHEFTASGNGMWIYNYVRYDRDYLHKPDGVRQRSYVGPTSYTDEFLFRDMADIAAKVPRGSSVSVTRAPRMASGERTPENDLAPTTSSFSDISRLGAHGAFTESYGGGTTNPRTSGFDALLLSGTRHYLAALARHTGRMGNTPYGVAGGPPVRKRLKLDEPSVMPATLPATGASQLGIGERIRSIWQIFRGGRPNADEAVYGPNGSTEDECVDCCKEALFGDTGIPDQYEWCLACCGARVEPATVPQECSDIGLNITMASCRGRCCFPNLPQEGESGFAHVVESAMENDPDCYNGIKDLLALAIKELEQLFAKVQWAEEIKRCLEMPWLEAVECIRRLIEEHPDGKNILTRFLDWLNKNAPRYRSYQHCCEAIVEALSPGDSYDPTKASVQCCERMYSMYIGSTGGLDEDYLKRFMNSIYCCFRCQQEDPTDSDWHSLWD